VTPSRSAACPGRVRYPRRNHLPAPRPVHGLRLAVVPSWAGSRRAGAYAYHHPGALTWREAYPGRVSGFGLPSSRSVLIQLLGSADIRRGQCPGLPEDNIPCPCRLRFVSSMMMAAYLEFLVTASRLRADQPVTARFVGLTSGGL
jgi:hypothetical protein